MPLTPGILGEAETAGRLHQFNMAWEKARIQRPIKIPPHGGNWTETSIVCDEIVQQIAQQGKANIFTTDEVAAAIMCSTRAVYSWDIMIKKFGTNLFIDKRDEEGAHNMLDLQTVSETALPDYTPLDDDSVNGVRQLMKEAAKIHTNVLQAAQDHKKFIELNCDDPHEEAEDQKMLRLGYRYKIYRL